MKFDSIIFDLDGTLWDSSKSVTRSWNQTLSHYNEVKNKLTVEDLQGAMGLQIQDIALRFFPDLEEEKRLEILKHCGKEECQYLEKKGGILYDEVQETLEKLVKNYKLFIVSNCQGGYIEAFFKVHGLEKYFIDYENPGRTGLTKGENIQIIIERNKLLNLVYVGDTQGDLEASRFAGIPFIYAKYGFGEVKEYDNVINRIEELLKL
ncbi:phosphoglycolate phosphatase [Natranaerovirga hydrolytica]|uniref:Phosphoglycolate phosphatase n=1 Tax=Natranaerovirga hydrolytica TaxID=680378 RepID=A0A4R1MZI5_9FIRM|nr:HAD family hydrolase [Natranaerovirga hydrolytica]TCK98747.1 phosphoglycolate phosphatase [Natranaerovirga hydrolytica]